MDKLKGMTGGMNPADLMQYVKGVSWPIGKDDLVAIMKQNNAPDDVTNKVQKSDASQFQDQGDLLSKIGM